MAGLHFDITGDNSNFLRKLDEARNGVRTTSKKIEESGMSIEQMFGRMAKGVAALGAGFSAAQLIKDVVRVRGEFQQLDVAFTTLLQSKEKANALMAQMVQTAAKTPFNLTELATGAKQLVAYGFASEGINNSLIRLGNIASGLGLPLERLTYLYGTTMTQGRLYTRDLMQFTTSGIPMLQGLADMFGVSTDKVNEMVTAGKVGFPEVQRVIENLTNEGGKFFNLMEEQSKTFTGKISNLGDAWDTMLNKIGQSQEGVINDSIDGLKYLVENYEAVGKTILELAATYGTYKAVLMSVAAYQGVATGIAYTAEITELSKLIPLKQQSVNQDVVAAVASGKLTQSKAEQVIALRAEIAAKIQSLQATEAQTKAEYASAMASYKNATQRMLLAKQNMSIAQSQMSIAIKSGTVDEIAAAKKNAQTASLELNNAAVVKNTAQKALNIAATNRKTASEALNTLETGKNSVAQTVNTTSTNILTTAKTRLAAASKALGLSMLANPYVLATAAIVGLGYGIYKLVTYQTDAEKAQLKLNDAAKESEKAALSEHRELAKLKGELAATTKGTEEYNRIKDQIVSKYGKYDKNLKDEIDKVGLLDITYQNLTKSIQQSFGARQYEKFASEQQEELSNTMAENLGNIQDRLLDELGNEYGSKIYAKIRDGVMRGSLSLGKSAFDIKGLDPEAKAALDKVSGVADNDFIRNKAIEGYIQNIILANKATDELNLKMKKRLGIDDNPVNTEDNGANNTTKAEQKAVSEWLSSYKKAYDDADKAYNDFLKSKQVMSDADRDKELKRLKELRDTAKTTYESKGGSASSDNKKETKEESAAEKLRKEQEKSAKELLSLRLQNQQEEINQMADGSEKKIAQINLDYDKEIAAILAKEKEWKEAQNGKLTEDQTKEIHVSFLNSYVKKERSSSIVDKDQLEAEKQAMNEYLAAYGNYQEKRKAITEKYNDLIAKATTEGEKLSLKKQLDEELKSLELSDFKNSINFAEVFGNLDNLTPDSITRLRDKLKEYINKAASGLRPEDLKELSDALSNIEIKAVEKNPFGEIGKSLEDYKSATKGVEDAQEKLNYVMAGGEIITGLYEDETGKLCKKLLTQEQAENNLVNAQNKRAETLERLNTSLAAGIEKASEYLDVAVAMTGALEDFGVEVPEQLTGFIDGMGKTLDSLASIDLTKPLSVIKGAIGAIGGIGKAIGSLFNNDHGKEKNVQRLQDQIETLDKSYELLGDSIEKAYSKDASKLIEDQNKLLEQQKILIQQQIQEEDDKKKTDNDKIKDWQNQLEEIDKTLADNKEKAIDAIFGEDLNSAIDNFAEAYADAWTSNTDKAQSAKDTVKKMMRQMVAESIKAAVESSKSMEKIREKLKEFYADNVLSGWEQDYIYNMAENLQKELDSQFGWADSLMKDEKDKEFDLGISSDSIADTIAEGLADGKLGFKDFAGSFEDMMRTAVINSLKTKYLEGPLKEFQKKFSDMSESGGQLTEAEIEELRGMYADIIDGAKAQFDSMKDIAGLDFTVDSDNSLKGAYAKASQESIDLLAGQTGAQRVAIEDIRNNMQPIREQIQFIRDLQVKGWEDVKAIRDLTVKIDKNSEQVASNTRMIHEVASKISENTRRSADALDGGRIDVNIKGM